MFVIVVGAAGVQAMKAVQRLVFLALAMYCWILFSKVFQGGKPSDETNVLKSSRLIPFLSACCCSLLILSPAME